MKSDKYIVFQEKQLGKDGCVYIKNIKYRIQKEIPNAFFLAGCSKGSTNMFLKSQLKNKFIVGNIFKNHWGR